MIHTETTAWVEHQGKLHPAYVGNQVEKLFISAPDIESVRRLLGELPICREAPAPGVLFITKLTP